MYKRVHKARKVLILSLVFLLIFTSFQFTRGSNTQAADTNGTFDAETGTLTLNSEFVAGKLKDQIDSVLPGGNNYADIKVLILTAGVIGVGKAADGNDVTGIINELTNLEDLQLIGNATTQRTSNSNSQGITPANLFSSANSKLKSVTLKNVTKIGANTFRGVTALTILVIPSVTSVEDVNAFEGISNLESIELGGTPPLTGPSLFPTDATFYVPATKVETYKSDALWGSVENRIQAVVNSPEEDEVTPPKKDDEESVLPETEAGVEGVAVITFDKTDRLVDLLREAGFDSTIPEQAAKLKKIVIKAGKAKKTLANADFNHQGKLLSNYINLTSFIIEKPDDPVHLTWNGNKIPNNAFKGLEKLREVKIGIATSNIGSSAFEGCISLETAEFLDTRMISPKSFKGNTSLTSLTFNKTYLPVGFEEFPGEPTEWFEDVDTSKLTVFVPTVAIEIFKEDEDWSTICSGCEIKSNGDDAEKGADEGPPATLEVEITNFTTKKLEDAIKNSPYFSGNFEDIRVLTIKAGILSSADISFIASSLKKLEELYIIEEANFEKGAIPKNAFEGNRYLRKIKAENVEEIDVKAFNLFESLEEVDFPDVKIIRSQAFAQVKGSSDSKLKIARFPKVEVIEQRAFYYCVNLEHLYLGSQPPTLTVPEGKQGLWFNFVTGMTIHVPDRAAFDEYVKVENSEMIDWSAFDFIAENGDELPAVERADAYNDANYDHLRKDHTLPFYNGDYKTSLNLYTFNMNLNSWIQGRTSPEPMTTFEAIKWAHENGFDAVDITAYYIPGYSNTAMPTEEQQKEILAFAKSIKEYSDNLGIAISGTGIQNNFADPNQKRRELDIERTKFYIQVAAEMGAPVIRVFAGPPPADILRSGWEAITKDRITPAIQEIADFAQENYPSVEIGVQNHGDMLATANQVLQLLEWVDRDNVGIVNDTGYYRDFMSLDARGYDWYSDIALILPYSNNFQVKKKPGGAETTELMDLERIFKDMRSSSYGRNGEYVPVELLWNPGDEGYPGDLAEPPYEETLAFLTKMKIAMDRTKRTDIYSDLSGIHLSSGGLNEEFYSGKTNYTQTVDNNVTNVTVTAKKAESQAVIQVNGEIVESGKPSGPIALNVGINTISIVVSGADAVEKTYTIEITREAQAKTPSLDLTPLEKLIAVAKAITNNDSVYTDSSFAALQTAIEEAVSALTSIKTEQDLMEALKELNAAIDGLVKVSPGLGDNDGGKGPGKDGDENQGSKGSSNDKRNQGKNSNKQKDKKGSKLPVTATSMFTMLLMGIALLLAGVGSMFVVKRRRIRG
ncbi:leucine-rich repeat protein [Bacillus sp. JJ1521]|uniref:leucine-rich repeat protein n=1 Tax=Bacillus sp. JJ1521 TaxID=3122957 RepID=UPI002FFDD111